MDNGSCFAYFRVASSIYSPSELFLPENVAQFSFSHLSILHFALNLALLIFDNEQSPPSHCGSEASVIATGRNVAVEFDRGLGGAQLQSGLITFDASWIIHSRL